MSTPLFHSGPRALASAATGLILALAIIAGPAAAGTPAHGRITHGDVSAAFQARTTGGYVNMLRSHTVAAPIRGLRDGRISFFADTIHCSADWQYVAVTLLAEGGYRTASVYLKATSVRFVIDGTPVASTMRTALKPFVGTGIHGQWGVSVGKLIAPGSIHDGEHTLETRITTPDFGTEILTATFVLTPDAC